MNVESTWLGGMQKYFLVLAALFQVGVLAAMTGITTVRHWNAEVYYLRTEPVDPRDMMRGDYVILSYPFERGGWQGGFADIPHDYSGPVYVPLTKPAGSKVSEPGKVSIERPAEGPYLRGNAQHGRLRFGIEQYFVQERKGLQFEEAARSRRLIAKVSVPSGGQGMVVGLEIEPPSSKVE